MAISPCWSGAAFLRVRAALAERDIWLRIAPHLVRPMRFAIPAHSDERPPWLLRSWLLLYDRLASPRTPAGFRDHRRHPPSGRQRAEAAIRHRVRIFRLRRGRFAAGGRQCGRCRGAGRRDPHRRALRSRRPARRLAAGGDRSRPSSGDHGAGARQCHRRLDRIGRRNRPAHAAAARSAPTRISQIIVRRLFETDNVYVFQNSDRRLIFASPYERDFTLIGTVGHAFKGDPAIVTMAAGDIAYLCDAANRYFRERVDPSDVIRTVSGANAVIGPPAGAPRGTAR